MNKDQILSIIRHILTAAGGILVAYGFLQEAATNELIGAAMMLVSTVWSMFDKTIMWERVGGVIRHVLTALGAFASVKAVLTPDMIEAVVSFTVTVLPIIQGQIAKAQAAKAAESVAAPVEPTTE